MLSSWDFWDTLVARRHMRDEIYWGMREGKTFEEAEAYELANLIPIRENVLKVQEYDYVVSDYGDGTDKWSTVIRKGLAIAGGAQQLALYVTPGGKYDGTVWPTLASGKPLLHTGDNQRADVDSPQQHGIKGSLVVRAPFTEAEQFINDNGFPQLAKLCREARLRTFNERCRGIEILQADYNFPVLFLGSIVLNRRFPNGETLLMSSRDCWQWVFLMNRLFRRGVYWYSSVIARKNADANYHRYIQSHPNPVLVDLCGSGDSFSKLPQYKSWLLYRPESGVKSIESFVTSPACMRLEQANVAPHEKAIGVDASFNPIFTNKSDTDFSKEPNTAAQVNAFMLAAETMKFYDLSKELQASNEQCHKVIYWLMHRYIDFKDAVEELRLLAIADDK